MMEPTHQCGALSTLPQLGGHTASLSVRLKEAWLLWSLMDLLAVVRPHRTSGECESQRGGKGGFRK